MRGPGCDDTARPIIGATRTPEIVRKLPIWSEPLGADQIDPVTISISLVKASLVHGGKMRWAVTLQGHCEDAPACVADDQPGA